MDTVSRKDREGVSKRFSAEQRKYLKGYFLFWEFLASPLISSVLAAYIGTDEGYNPQQVGMCQPSHSSPETATFDQAKAVAIAYEQRSGQEIDTAAGDGVWFQTDRVNTTRGLGEIVCRTPDHVLRFTTAGSQIAHNPAFTSTSTSK